MGIGALQRHFIGYELGIGQDRAVLLVHGKAVRKRQLSQNIEEEQRVLREHPGLQLLEPDPDYPDLLHAAPDPTPDP